MPSFSFGSGRGAYENLYQKHAKGNTDKSIPGPGTYTVPSIFNKKGENSYSLKGRGKSMQDLMINKKRELPGPGQYSPRNTINKNGTYQLSTLRNIKTTSFKPSDRFKTARSSMPGPGQYDMPSSIRPDGKHFVSNFRSSGVGIFRYVSNTHI